MTKITAIFLLVAMLGQNFSTSFIVMDYYAFRDAYRKKCINKLRPQLHCNGKCQLMKKLKEEENKEQATSTRVAAKFQVLPARAIATQAPLRRIRNLLFLPAYETGLPPGHADTAFHPPQRLFC